MLTRCWYNQLHCSNFITLKETSFLQTKYLTQVMFLYQVGWILVLHTLSRIRCNAVVNGHTGFAELNAASSYDMVLNLQTTRVNCGWVYHKINNDNCLLLSGSGQFVKHFKPIVASSDGRLKENEVIIDSACGTLSKLRPQIYDKTKHGKYRFNRLGPRGRVNITRNLLRGTRVKTFS